MIDEKFLAKLSILFIDNDSKLRNKYKQIFEKLFKKVLISPDGLDAIEQFNNANKNNEHIDIIVSETSLPYLNGIEFLNHVKKINKNIPFIFTATSTKTEDLITSIKKGVDDYFTKPVDIFLLLKQIEKSCLKKLNNHTDSSYINELEEYLNAINKVAIVIIFDDNGKILYVNDFLIEVSKYLEEELLEKDYNFTYHSDISKTIIEKQWSQLQDSKKWKGKIKHLAKNDSIFYTNTTILPVINKNNKEKKSFISINFLATEEENKKRDYKKKVLYNLQETKRVYKVAQDKIDQLKEEISKYEDISKYEIELEKEKVISLEYYEEIKDYKNKILKLDNNKIKIVEEEISIKEELIKKITNEILN